ncbi:phytase [Marinivivus vitaminiproducens]|uniref:phytase n=1 Tax=Marinivivus vitaminiproducens TaxID=3035935 RepID=UPI0027A89814|nr:phytase [Geminicoccaceae bacterium SCSIO 64248]
MSEPTPASSSTGRVTVGPFDLGSTMATESGFAGATDLASDTEFEGTVVGGLSGLTYDPETGHYLAISDDSDAGADGTPRFYELAIDLGDGSLDEGDVSILDVTPLTLASGATFDALSTDTEGVAIDAAGDIFISSERDFAGNPGIYRLDRDGVLTAALPVEAKFQPDLAGTSGVRDNLGFESLTITPDKTTLYTATESALTQDGDVATLTAGAASRIIRYDLATGRPVAEYVYETDPIARAPEVEGGFADAGLVDLLALDDQGTLLALERSFSAVEDTTGEVDRGYSAKLFLVHTQGATNVLGEESLPVSTEDDGLAINVDATARKELLLDLSDLGLTLDNLEGMTLGPVLADGRQSLTLVSDDNFGAFGPQSSQFITLALDLDDTPTVAPVSETPDTLRYYGPNDPVEGADPDDPAIWVNPEDAGASVVVTAMKNGGLRVYDLAGTELQAVEPEGVRYNNVDILKSVALHGETVDVAVASDRANDTLAFYAIGADGTLSDVTAADLPASIFGVDDGEATAYGLAAYTSPEDGRQYVFVTQASGASIAQLEVVAKGDRLSFEPVRTLTLPVAEGADPVDYQSEGIAIDQETGVGYVTVEDELGLLAFSADPDGGDDFEVVSAIDSGHFSPDLEGVAIHYGEDGEGLIVVSSQGDNSFAVFDRETWDYRGAFAIRSEGGIDGVEESDGLEIYSGALPGFEDGLLVTQDGSNEIQAVFADAEDGEVQNFNVNFKYSDLGDVLALFEKGTPGLDITVAARFQGEYEEDPEAASEIVDYAKGKIYVTNGNLDRIDIFSLAHADQVGAIDLTELDGFSGVQSVSVSHGLVAAAVSIENREVALPPSIGGTATVPSNGIVAFYDAKTHDLIRTVEVGNLPDMLTFSKDGKTLLVANEGEFNTDSETDSNPAGSVSIISTEDFSVRTVDFAALDGFEDEARAAGIRVAPGVSAALDMEPEYVALSPDESRAYVTLQENNAIAVIDVASANLVDILPAGTVDHSAAGNEIDPLDDGVINLRGYSDLVGLRMPDGIVSFEIGGETYFATANEGDGRGDAPEFDEARVGDLLEEGLIDPSVDTDGLERLAVSAVDGDTDSDGDIDVLNAFGGRSFTIYDAEGAVVYESGSELGRLIADVARERFQDDEGTAEENRSDAKGVEPEAIEVGEIDGDTFLFVGMERDSGIAVLNVSDPTAPALVEYIDGFASEDIAPEGLEFVPATDAEDALLLASYELSGTTVAYRLSPGAEAELLV